MSTCTVPYIVALRCLGPALSHPHAAELSMVRDHHRTGEIYRRRRRRPVKKSEDKYNNRVIN